MTTIGEAIDRWQRLKARMWGVAVVAAILLLLAYAL